VALPECLVPNVHRPEAKNGPGTYQHVPDVPHRRAPKPRTNLGIQKAQCENTHNDDVACVGEGPVEIVQLAGRNVLLALPRLGQVATHRDGPPDRGDHDDFFVVQEEKRGVVVDVRLERGGELFCLIQVQNKKRSKLVLDIQK